MDRWLWVRVVSFVAVVALGTYRYGPSPFWIPVANAALLYAIACFRLVSKRRPKVAALAIGLPSGRQLGPGRDLVGRWLGLALVCSRGTPVDRLPGHDLGNTFFRGQAPVTSLATSGGACLRVSRLFASCSGRMIEWMPQCGPV